jgi:hypothetical protein
MKPLDIQKIAVQAKSRTLKASWTMETADEAFAAHGLDVEDEIRKILQAEIDREILETLGWTKVTVVAWDLVDDAWCKKYIKGKYKCFGVHWMFEDDRDATFFTLKWNSNNAG